MSAASCVLQASLSCLTLIYLFQARYCITTQSEWRDTDGAWNAREFASTIYEYAGSHKQWVHNLLKWWNRCVFSVSRTFKY